jgi:DNA-binding HxlR family transcriptional regulator
LLWIRPLFAERGFAPDERRVREFVDAPGGVSESVASLSRKLGIPPGRLRRILDGLVEAGVLQRREYADIQPIYTRFPGR